MMKATTIPMMLAAAVITPVNVVCSPLWFRAHTAKPAQLINKMN
jgi:hypothetical protein